MSTQKAKFELFARLQALGFTYDEALALRRIEMTLHRWAEMECGDEYNRCIERDEATGKPFMTYDAGQNGKRGSYPIADREAGALRRLKAIVDARNARFHREATANRLQNYRPGGETESSPLIPYHQGDPRGCALYLVKTGDLSGQSIDSIYNRGLAVCA